MSGYSSDAECSLRGRGHECIRHGNEGFGTCQPPQGCRTTKDCRIGYTCNYLGNCHRVFVTPCSVSIAYGRRGSTVACKPGYECVSDGWGMGRCHPQCRTNQDCSYGYTCNSQSIAWNAMYPNLYLFYGPQNGVCNQPLQSPQPPLPPPPPPPPPEAGQLLHGCETDADCSAMVGEGN